MNNDNTPCLFFTDLSIVSSSKGFNVIKSITSASISSTAWKRSVKHTPHASKVTALPSRTTLALPSGIVYSPPGTSSFIERYSLVDSRNMTGSGSLIDEIKSPFALYGDDGTTTFTPGI